MKARETDADRDGRSSENPDERPEGMVPEREDGPEVSLRFLGHVVKTMQSWRDEERLETAEREIQVGVSRRCEPGVDNEGEHDRGQREPDREEHRVGRNVPKEMLAGVRARRARSRHGPG